MPDPSLLEDQMAASKDRVDLSVFGIRLGDPLSLPPCGVSPGGPTDACVVSGPRAMVLSLSARAPTGRLPPRVSGVADVPVQLPASKCPNWLAAGRTGCTVFFTTKGGYTAAAFFPVGGDSFQDSIEAGLTEKYHRAPNKYATSPCPAPRAKVRVWALSGLRVAYDPVSSRCNRGDAQPSAGVIEVSTNTYTRLVQSVAAQKESAQPKM
jgi:hypothetical protein